MQLTTLGIIKQKSINGIIALTTRTFILQTIAFTATAILIAYLDPSMFGVFYLVSAVINFLKYFSDIGLAAALIQKKSELTEDDLKTTFTIQQILVLVIILISILLSGWIKNFYNLEKSGILLYYSLIFSFFLSSLKTIPSILLERKLEFQKLIIPQIFETIGFYSVAVVMAVSGYGVVSFAYGAVTQAIVGLIVIYLISPWPIAIGYSYESARKLLHFGVPFQVNSLLALVKDDLFTVFLAKILPLSQIGYIGWAKKWAEIPLRLFLDSVVKVTFPAFSRLQHDRKVLANAINQTLFGITGTIFPVSVGLLFFIKPIMSLIPRYAKWEPALLSFSIFVVSSAISSLSVPLTNTFNAIGKIRITLKFMILWTTLTWIFSYLGIRLIGFNGVAIAFLIITTTVILVVLTLKRYVEIKFINSIKSAAIASLTQAVWYYLLFKMGNVSLLQIIFIGLSGVLLYLIVIYNLDKARVKVFINYFKYKKIL